MRPLAIGSRHTRRERDAARHELRVVSEAVAALTSVRSTSEVLDHGVRIAAELVSPSLTSERRAVYFLVEGDTARVLAEFDERGHTGPEIVRLAEHAPLAEVVATLTPVLTSFADGQLTGAARRSAASKALTHGAAVPVVVDGRLHGVLAVAGRGRRIVDVTRLVDVAGVVALALSHALVAEELERQATTDALTGCLNRRGLEFAARSLSSRRPFAVVLADLDALKEINDGYGHERGDQVLADFATHVRDVVRTGDAVARIGGDEFLVLLHDADVDSAVRLAQRILQRPTTTISLGIASATDPAAFAATWRAADEAMYEAKRAGGNRYAIAQQVASSS